MRADDERAFDTFAHAQAAPLLRLARLMAASEQDAEDLVQDTLLLVYRKWGQVSAADSPAAYANRMLVNQSRTSRRRRRFATVAAHEDEVMGSDMAASGDIEEALALRGALRQLPERQRVAIVLRYYMHMSSSEIAEVMALKESSVRAALSRAIATLRESAVIERSRQREA